MIRVVDAKGREWFRERDTGWFRDIAEVCRKTPNKINNWKAKRVSQYTPDGMLIKHFGSISQAMRETKNSIESIKKGCKNQEIIGGFRWRYLND
jgi:hypothetical protein